MKPGLAIALAAEFLEQWLASGAPCDRVLDGYCRARKFLGAGDRRQLAAIVFGFVRRAHAIDRALWAGLAPALEGRALAAALGTAAGFPLGTAAASQAWRRKKGPAATHSDSESDPDDSGGHVAAPAHAAPQTSGVRDQRWVHVARAGIAGALDPESGIDLALLEAELARAMKAVPARAAEALLTALPTALPAALDALRETESLARAKKRTAAKSAALAQDLLPEWFVGALAPVFGKQADLGAFAATVLDPAPIALRINRLRTDRPGALQALDLAGIAHTPGALDSDAVLLDARVAHGALSEAGRGFFEFQDEGSQLVSRFAAPATGQVIVDACAGGGGKSLALAALLRNQGTVLAWDRDARRLDETFRRADLAGAECVARLPAHAAPGGREGPASLKADLVVLDVPCSGTGTLRRSPETLLRLSPEAIGLFAARQRDLLETWHVAARAPGAAGAGDGGTVLYITCSILHEECEAVIEAFLAAHPGLFVRDAAPGLAALRAAGVDPKEMLSPAGDLRLFPHRHGTDGFFACRLRRVA